MPGPPPANANPFYFGGKITDPTRFVGRAAELRFIVLCLDEFEALLERPQEFDNAFYDALRAWMDDQLLMLVVASAQPLTYYGGRHRFVSRFFNLGNTTYLDEFQRLDEVIAATGNRAALNFLRDTIEHRRRWRLLLAGSVAADEMAAYWSDTLINTRRLHISYLRTEEARELIEHPLPGFEQQMQYEPAAVAVILELTHGQPFLVQLLGAELVDRLNLAHRRRAVADDVEAVLSDAFAHASDYFQEIWDSVSATEQSLLLGVATGAANGGDPQGAARLVRRELLEPVDGALRFQAPPVARWFQRKAAEMNALDASHENSA